MRARRPDDMMAGACAGFDASEFGWRRRFWLTRDYLPEVAGLVAGWSLARLADAIGARTEPVLIPWDCADGFLEAYWRRPEAYLDDHVRRAASMWTRVGPEAEQRAARSLRDDLASSRWAERNRDGRNRGVGVGDAAVEISGADQLNWHRSSMRDSRLDQQAVMRAAGRAGSSSSECRV